MEMTIEEWLQYGIENGYCTEVFCDTHDGGPASTSEWLAFDEGLDLCRQVVRIGTVDEWEEDARASLELSGK
jgi:hypothetical protein